MKIAVLSGSVREHSNSLRCCRLIADELQRLSVTSDLVDPRSLSLCLPGLEKDNRKSQLLRDRVSDCDGAVLVTPEYDGSYSSVIKLLIEHLGYPSVLAGKPVHLLGVASGEIGAVKALEHLRSVCGSIGTFVLPQSISVRKVHEIFDGKGGCINSQAESLVRSVAVELVTYLQSGSSS